MIQLVWETPVFRGVTISLLLAGIGASAAIPLLTVFFVQELGVSPAFAALYFLTALAGPLVSVVTGRVSDRIASRMPLIRASGVWMGVGWLLLAGATEFWMVIAISIVCFSFMGTQNAQLFSVVRDVIHQQEIANEARLVTTIRTAYAVGWVVGPVLGSWFGLTVGLRQLFLASAVFCAASALPVLRMQVTRYAVVVTPAMAIGGVRRATGMLWLFVILAAFALSQDTVKLSFLPLFMDEGLSAPAWQRGAVISTQPLTEVVLIPLAGLIAERIGAARVLVAGAVCGVLGNVLFAVSDAIWMLFVGQVLVAALIAAVLGLGVTVAQDLYPQGVGYASSAFFGGIGMAAMIGGLLGSVSVGWLGLPRVFFVTAAVTLVVLAGFLVFERRMRTQATLSTGTSSG